MAVMGAPTIFLFDRWDERIGTLPVMGRLVHTEELGGEDTLEFECALAPAKGDRLLWRDPDDGRWREHVVVRTDETWGAAARVYAESALSELLGDFVEDRQLMLKTPDQGLAAVLETTRWEAGAIDVPAHQRSCYLYHVNALAALRRVEEVWEGEAEMGIEVDDLRVVRRTVALRRRIGAWRGARLVYGKNAASCTRTVLEDEVVTALYGFGRGLPILDETGAPTGGFTRRLTFADVNGGVPWIGDEDARERWGIWDAERKVQRHRFGQAVFADCEEPNRLLGLTRAALAGACEPRVTYEAEIAAFEGAPAVLLGDDVAVVDPIGAPGQTRTYRVARRVRAFGDARRMSVTLGEIERTTWAAAGEMTARMASVEETAASASDSVASIEDLEGKRF